MSLIGMVSGILRQMAGVHPIFLFVIFLAFVFISYKIFKVLVKAIVIGIIAAMFPFFANYLGVSMPTDLNTMMWFGVFGVLFVLAYKIVYSVLKALGAVLGGGEKAKIRKEVKKELERGKKEKPGR